MSGEVVDPQPTLVGRPTTGQVHAFHGKRGMEGNKGGFFCKHTHTHKRNLVCWFKGLTKKRMGKGLVGSLIDRRDIARARPMSTLNLK